MVLLGAFLPLISATSAPFSSGQSYTIHRDNFGVPVVQADTISGEAEGQGFAAAQDRMWQMDVSRHLAEGRLGQFLGSKFAASDADVLKTGYSFSEVDAQYAKLSATAKEWMEGYAAGVNSYLHKASEENSLPDQYRQNNLKPEPWTTHDSLAVGIRLFDLFGRGGAGEIRDLALVKYLQSRPQTKKDWLKVFHDIAWLQDPASVTTVPANSDPLASNHPEFPAPTESDTLNQLKEIPAASLFELLPAVQISEMAQSKLVAQTMNVPFQTGSYCVVVSPDRSTTGKPMLLSGPQMGLTDPSIIHECGLRGPVNVSGMDLPGVPGILIGANPNYTWGITSGVADVEDIFCYKKQSGQPVDYDGITHPIESVPMQSRVGNTSTETPKQARIEGCPIVAQSAAGYFVLRSAFRMKEYKAFDTVFALDTATNESEIDHAISDAPVSFNFFFAMKSGDIGYHYTGFVPLRNNHLDPRLPTPFSKANDWKGFIPFDQMPHTLNPKSGVLTNWNNKPATWWPNGDTPVWGKVFQISAVNDSLPKGKISPEALELVPWTIARKSPTFDFFKSETPFLSYEGWSLDGSVGTSQYAVWLETVRKELFGPAIGSLLNQSTFDTVLQPTVIDRALHFKTEFPYANRAELAKVLADAKAAAMAVQTPFAASEMTYGNGGVMPYTNRGSYIQIVELMASGNWFARSIIPPGEAESGPHQFDQLPLAAAWRYKPSVISAP